MFYYIRVSYKLLKRRYFLIDSFCKVCGRDVSDFSVDDAMWNKVDKTIKRGHVLCYDCFCEKCKTLNLPTVWRLKLIKDKEDGLLDIEEFSKETFKFTKSMGWKKDWIHGGCYIHLEASEFIEALRGKGDPVEELGDLLITVFSTCEHYNISITDGIKAARNKMVVLGKQHDILFKR